MRWLVDHGVGGETSAPGPTPSSPRLGDGVDLSGSDCSDGLLRCVDGVVEASRAAHLPAACGPSSPRARRRVGPRSPEGQHCDCPYEAVSTCEHGCAEENLEVVGEPTDAGVAQLCRPVVPVARPVLTAVVSPEGGAATICSDEGVACRDDVVVVCDRRGAPSRLLGRCVHGCATVVAVGDVDALHPQPGTAGTTMNPDGVLAILCRRDDAERR